MRIKMEFEWDVRKAEINLQKHGVSFDDAVLIFNDENLVEFHDSREDYREDRWIGIGSFYNVVLYVVYTFRENETIRIISARKALQDEQKQYYQLYC